MPGIVGLITKKPRDWAERRVQQMLESLHRESFYETGTWSDESLGVYAGWSAQKNSFSDGMPLWNEKGDVSLIFSGEEYREPGTVCRLKQRGHLFEADGPSYLVHLYEEDPCFPLGLNGLFHGLVCDRRRRTAMLFNDRYGMHRMFYRESSDAFYFSAEAKAIAEVCPELREMDLKSFGEIIACGCVLENRTIFKGIQALPNASAWIFRDAEIERKLTYFHPQEWEQQSPQEPESFYQELKDVFSRNLPRYFNGHQPVGMTLTGGLDTRAIMAWHRPEPGSLRCYTFGGAIRDCEDVRLGRRVADVCQQSHEVLTIGEEFVSRFPYYAERSVAVTEGGVEVSHASDLYVSEKAREQAPVKVVGTYGSEIVRLALMFKPMSLTPGLYSQEILPYVRQAEETYIRVRKQHPVTFAAFRQFPWYHHGILALEQSQLTVRSPYLDNDFVKTVYRAPKFQDPHDDVRLRLVEDGNPKLAQFRTDRGIGGNVGSLSAAASRWLLDFTNKAEYAYDYGMPQWVARIDHALAPLRLERLFLGRHKALHYRVWYRDSLADYVRQMLLDPLTLSRPYVDRKGLEAVVQGHLKGDRNYTTEIHKLLTLELINRLFTDPR